MILCRYSSMAWVGLTFYALHFPLILTAIWSGQKVLSATASALTEPLLGSYGEAVG